MDGERPHEGNEPLLYGVQPPYGTQNTTRGEQATTTYGTQNTTHGERTTTSDGESTRELPHDRDPPHGEPTRVA